MPSRANDSRIGSRRSSSVSRVLYASIRRKLNKTGFFPRRPTGVGVRAGFRLDGINDWASGPRGRLGAVRLLEVTDEGLFQGRYSTSLHKRRRDIGREYPAVIHQRNPVTAGCLIHEMSGDENGHVLIARQSRSGAPRIGRVPGDPLLMSARQGSASRVRVQRRRRAKGVAACREAGWKSADRGRDREQSAAQARRCAI